MADIEFKSKPYMFEKEKSGVKNNTVRFLDLDYRFDMLRLFEAGQIKELSIKIINRYTLESFVRSIRDVAIHNQLFIITWEV